MADEAGQTEKPPAQHRPLPGWAGEMIFIALVLLVLIILLLPTCTTRGPQKVVQDLSNIHQVLIAISAYAIDNNNQLPEHIKLLSDYGLGREVFASPFDLDESLAFDDNTELGWYQYGSYRFLSAEHIKIDDVKKAADFILVYRTPRPDSDSYIVGFLDGHVESISSEDFAKRMDLQGGLVSQSNNESIRSQFPMLYDSDE
ncbi:MAG: hypothetical protein AAF085_00210 [Planctomycetota bacterium]